MNPYYEQDGITIYHGDCRDLELGMSSIDCIVTSPPYNLLHSMPKRGTGLMAGHEFIDNWHAKGYPDEMPEDEYQQQQNAIFSRFAEWTKPTGSLFYNHQLRWFKKTCVHPIQWFHPAGWMLRQEMIWDKSGGIMLNAMMFCQFDQRVLWFTRTNNWKWNQAAASWGTVWRIAPQQKKPHPVAFPLEIPQRCIAAATDRGDMVVDPFMGSGTTLVAAQNLGRRAIGVDRDERYCEMAAIRLRQTVLDLGGQ